MDYYKYYKIQQDIEWRQYQNLNHQLVNVNRAHSQGSIKFDSFHSTDKLKLGQLMQDKVKTRKEELQDPLIKLKLIGTKLIKWRFFVFFEKFLDFDENIIHDVIRKVDMYQGKLHYTKEE